MQTQKVRYFVFRNSILFSAEVQLFSFRIRTELLSFQGWEMFLRHTVVGVEEEPKNLIYNIKDGKKTEEGAHIRLNSIKRIADQRNFLKDGIIDASKDDLILYSDNDEIPNLEFFDSHKINRTPLVATAQLGSDIVSRSTQTCRVPSPTTVPLGTDMPVVARLSLRRHLVVTESPFVTTPPLGNRAQFVTTAQLVMT